VSTVPPDKIQVAIEDLHERAPEWQELERGYGHDPQTRLRSIQWDPIHDWIQHEGPTVLSQPPVKRAP